MDKIVAGAGPWESTRERTHDGYAMYEKHDVKIKIVIDGDEVAECTVTSANPDVLGGWIQRKIREKVYPIPEFAGFDWPEDVKQMLATETVGTWKDFSYHNDAMPHLANEDLRLVLWVNFPKNEREEGLDWAYSVQILHVYEVDGKREWDYGDDVLVATESWNEVATVLNQRRSEVEHA